MAPSLLEQLSHGVLLLAEGDQRLLYHNPSAERLTGPAGLDSWLTGLLADPALREPLQALAEEEALSMLHPARASEPLHVQLKRLSGGAGWLLTITDPASTEPLRAAWEEERSWLMEQSEKVEREKVDLQHMHHQQLMTHSRQLQKLNEELERALSYERQDSQLKDQFLSSLNHELRTPLNAILGLSEVLLEGVYGALSEKQAKAQQVIFESAQKQLEMITDLLDYAHIGAGKILNEPQLVSLDSVLRGLEAQFSKAMKERSLRWTLRCAQPGIELRVDPAHLGRVLAALLSNAIKFTPHGGSLGLQVMPLEQEQLRICVWDEGLGIAEARIQELLAPFVQGEPGLTRSQAGFGLGLALSSRLLSLMGGELEIESALGEGSRFTVILREVGVRAPA